MFNPFKKAPASGRATLTSDTCQGLIDAGTIPKFEDILAHGYKLFLSPGDVAVDIGVHAGFHFDQILERVGATGKVIGFEPVPDFANPVLARHDNNADIRLRAISDKRGRSSFLHMTKAAGESGFIERATKMDRGAVTLNIEISTLDNELSDLTKLDYIKIDTEGHEISALNGGLNTIHRLRPIISVEYGAPTYTLYGHTSQTLYDWSVRNKYLISDLFGNIVIGRHEWEYVCDHGYWDFYLVPTEKASWWNRIFQGDPVPLLA